MKKIKKVGVMFLTLFFIFTNFSGFWSIKPITPELAGAATTASFGNLAGIDELGRILPDYGDVPEERDDRYVGIFYFLWKGQHGNPAAGAFDITKILAQYPNAVNNANHHAWGNQGAFHFFAEPLYGYYQADDAWVIRKHVQQLTDAGIDFLVVDATNGYTYKKVYDVLLPIFEEYRLQGWNVPKIVFYTNTRSGETVTEIYNDLYKPNRYPELWFRWKGKPMIIGEPNEVSQEVRNFFTFRLNQWPWTHEPQKINGFPWMDFVRPQRVFYNDLGEKEVINVSIAQHQDTVAMSDGPFYNYGNNWGRSWRQGSLDTSPEAYKWGYNFQEQWDFALEQDPQIIFITGWNEWIAQRLAANDPARPLTFCDLATVEYSRDAEMIKGFYKDNYYMQIMDNVRRFKGIGPQAQPSEPKSITVNNDFSQWQNVSPTYKDYVGDTVNRNHKGYANVTYTNNTGRNDFETLKVTRDSEYVYFYTKTVNNITTFTDPNWMMLLIDSDNDMTNGWEGYDFIVNRTGKTATTTTVEASTGGWNWGSVGTVKYVVSGKEMHIAIPRSYLGLDNTSKPINIRFKWTDNMQDVGDVMDFYVNGDTAPHGRLSYVYTEEKPTPPKSKYQIAIKGAVAGESRVQNQPKNSYDSNWDTYWRNIDSLENAWIEYDLGNIYKITGLKIMLTDNHLRTHPIKIEVDGVEVWNGNTYLQPTDLRYQTITFPVTFGRQVRIKMTGKNSANNNVLGIRDVEINGRLASTPVSIDLNWIDVVKSWEFIEHTEGWVGANQISGFSWQTGGYVGGSITGADPWILSPTNLGVNISEDNMLFVRMKNNTSSNTAEVFWGTPEGSFSQERHIAFPIVPNDNYYREYWIDMSQKNTWTGTLNQLRIDPSTVVTDGSFSIDYIKIGTMKARNHYTLNTSSGIIASAKASSVGSTNKPENTYDGNTATKFRTGAGDWTGERWIEYTLNDSYTINGLKILFDNEWSPSTKIYPMRIEVNGLVVWQGNSLPSKVGMQLFELNSTIGDSVRIVMTGPATFLPNVDGETNNQQPNNFAISQVEFMYESLDPEQAAVDAVVAYESAPISNLDEISQAGVLETKAIGLIEKLEVGDLKNQLEARIAVKKAEVDIAKENLEAEGEVQRQTEAEAAISAYESSLIDTLEAIAVAELLEATANAKAALVQDEDVKAAFEARIAARKLEVEAAKNNMGGTPPIYGDVNGDKQVTNIDLILLRRYIAGITVEDFNGEAADVNADGKVTNVDLILLQRYIAGLLDSLGPQ